MSALRNPNSKSVPRLSLEVSEEVYWKVHKYLPFGMQKRVFGIVINDLLSMFDKYGQHFLIALLQKEITYKGLMEKYTLRMEENPNDEITEPS